MSPLLLFGSLIFAFGGVFLFNALPDRWFCDYGEAPVQKRRSLPLLPGILCFAGMMTGTWLAAGQFLTGAAGPMALLFVWLCLLISASDILYHILPDQFIIAVALVGIVYALLDFEKAYLNLIGAIAGGGILLLIGIIGKLIFKAEAMGFGDVKLTAALGLVCGLPGIFYALMISLVSGAVAALPVMIKSREKRPYLPFAPFLCLGGISALIFSRLIDNFVLWYLSLI